MSVEFKPWPKIGRITPFKVTITEKIDGTNACIIINEDSEIIGVQSRKKLITPDNDNFEFAQWVYDNEEDIRSMGHGYHYGEWAGVGIQKNPHGLEGRKFFLFNSARWNDNNPNRPDCCDVVPVLYRGNLEPETIPNLLSQLQAQDEIIGTTSEGVVVYYHAFDTYTKHTIKSPNGKWCKE